MSLVGLSSRWLSLSVQDVSIVTQTSIEMTRSTIPSRILWLNLRLYKGDPFLLVRGKSVQLFETSSKELAVVEAVPTCKFPLTLELAQCL
jgi:hypothetical protein